MQKELVVLSVFDGKSCGQIALNELGYNVKYYASEIDKFAIKVTQANYPNTIQLGDIENWREWDVDWKTINLFIGGSPCQGFSFAGKQLNFHDPRSKLFFIYVDILNHIKKFNPDVKFLLENVIMKKQYQRVINQLLGLFPVEINSSLVSAQNRRRLYWSNIKIKMVGLFNEIHTDIPQPEDKGILLKDILQDESEVGGKYYLTNKAVQRMVRKNYSKPKINLTKTNSLSTNNNSSKQSFDSGTTLIGMDLNKKSKTRRASGFSSYDKKHNHEVICVSMVGRKIKNGKRADNDQKIKAKQQLEPTPENKTNCLTGVHKDNLITDGYKLRRLTPIECERLQTVPDNYTSCVSDTQRYKMLGNGWTIEVIKHIFSFL